MIRTVVYFFVLILLSFSSCDSTDSQENKLMIATAANAQFALKELAANFSRKHNVTIDIILGSSGKLTTQILNGAPYDLFFSANMQYPSTLFKKGKTEEKPIIYGYGVPVLWTAKEKIAIDSFFNDSTVERIAIANPKNAPYGEMAVKYLEDNNIYPSVESKLVYGESISQVNEYILNKTADIGVSAKSIVVSPKLKGKGVFKELDKAYWIEQGAVVIKNDNLPELKQKFMEYLQSKEGVELLETYGYSIR